MSITDHQRRDIDKIWDRLVEEHRFRDLGFKFSDVLGATATAAPITLWVDAVNGSDLETGVSDSKPLKTIAAAAAKVPLTIKHLVHIKVRAGAYVETVFVSAIFPMSVKYIIESVDWLTPTLTSGPTSGTIASVSNKDLTVSGATWTVNELRGKFLKITSGASINTFTPIASNTANTIEIPSIETALAGQTFEIVDPGATWDKAAGQSSCVETTNLSRSYSSSMEIKGFKFLSTVQSITNGNGGLSVTSCWTAAGSTPIFCTGAHSQLFVSRCYVNVAASGVGIYPFRAFNFFVSRTVIRGPGGGSGTGIWFIDANLVHFAGIIENCAQALRATSGGTMATAKYSLGSSTSPAYLRDSTNGIQLGGSHGNIMGWVEITNSAGHGIHLLEHAQAGNGFNTIALVGGKITGTAAGSDAIYMESAFNRVEIDNAFDISGNARWGVNLAPAYTARYNCCLVGSAVTMSTNTSGDMTLDGTAATTVAALRGDADKTIVDAVRFNTLAGA